MEIKSLDTTSPDELYKAFNEAFSDYARSWSREEFDSMLKRRGYNAALSFGAFENGRLVSFTLNGTGTFNNQYTAYDTGTGTLKEYRTGGLATQVFEASLPHLISAGLNCYLLEVLQDNAKAISVYSKLGFAVSREFNYFIQNKNEIRLRISLPAGYSYKEISVDPDIMSTFWDFDPSWQNSFAAIERSLSSFKVIGAFYENALVAYGVIELQSGDVPQLAVHKAHRRKGIATALLKQLAYQSYSLVLKFINTDAHCTDMTHFLTACNLSLGGRQFEMIKPLN